VPDRGRARRTALAAGAIAALAAGGAFAEPALWKVSDGAATVYVFGSVHVLTEGGFRSEGALEDAYDDAERVCMELDPAAAGEAETLALTLGRAIDPEGRDLFELLGADADRVRERAEEADVDLAPYASFEPWFAGLTVSLVALQAHGYDAAHGVEQVIHAAASEDGKEVCGLETLDAQLAMLDSMPASSQSSLLLQSLEEAARIEELIGPIVAAWQEGDLEFMEERLAEDVSDYPELADPLIFDRNERWADEVAGMLEDSDDVLLVVGAMHLAGDRGLPSLLEKRGYSVTRL
jgi:uncharacterized protein